MTRRLDHPQRLALPSPFGALSKRLAGAHARLKLEAIVDNSPTYLADIRQLPCLKCGIEPCGVAAHLRMNSGLFNKRQAMAKRPSSKWTLPLCAGCHTNDPDSQHRVGEQIFWDSLGINPLLVAEKLWAKRGDLVAMRAVIFTAIAERG